MEEYHHKNASKGTYYCELQMEINIVKIQDHVREELLPWLRTKVVVAKICICKALDRT